jgi:ATP/ADP translocase
LSETLVGRQEKQGRYFPMWLERILLVLTIFAMYLFHSDIGDFFQSQGTPTWLTFIIEWCLLPISLLVLSELISRIMQAVHSD